MSNQEINKVSDHSKEWTQLAHNAKLFKDSPSHSCCPPPQGDAVSPGGPSGCTPGLTGVLQPQTDAITETLLSLRGRKTCSPLALEGFSQSLVFLIHTPKVYREP